jgi:hypothetical protein
MKTMFITAAMLSLAAGTAVAQCQHEPTITPNNIILCPNESDTLWTQQYDSYQWYRGGNPIPGATNQYYVVSYYQDAGYYFTVETMLNSCTEMAPQVLVDGWAFLPLYVMTEGDYTIDGNGMAHACPGDTVYLILPPGQVNIQWTDNGNPIPGATDDTLIVLNTGSYSVSASPAVCPNYPQQLGVLVDVVFSQLPVPAVSAQAGVLTAAPASGYSYQWYLNGNAIPGATSSTYTPSVTGSYAVEITDSYGCSAISAPYQFTVTSVEKPVLASVKIYPNPSAGRLYIEAVNMQIEMINAIGQTVLTQSVNGKEEVNIEAYPAGTYLIRAVDATGNSGTFLLIKE